MRNTNKEDWSKLLPEDPEGADALWDAAAGFGESPQVDVEQAWQQFEKKLSAKVGQPKTPKRRFKWKRSLTAAAAAVALLFVINFFSADDTITEFANVEASAKTLLLEDNTEVILMEGASLKVKMEDDARVVELLGEASFDVASNPSRPFTLTTPELNLIVVGTEFTVRSGDGASVNVSEGHVRVRGRNEADWTDLYAGDGITINEALIVNSVEPIASSGVPLRFDAVRLSKVVSSIEEAHDIKLLIPAKLADCSITADFSSNTVTEIASTLAVLFDADMSVDGNTVQLKGGRCQ